MSPSNPSLQNRRQEEYKRQRARRPVKQGLLDTTELGIYKVTATEAAHTGLHGSTPDGILEGRKSGHMLTSLTKKRSLVDSTCR